MAALLAACALVALVSCTATDPPHRSFVGQLLVADDDDPPGGFAHTVVWVLLHDTDGATGVVLTRPTDESSRTSRQPTVLFDGGPVDRDVRTAVLPGSAPDDRAPRWQELTGTEAVPPATARLYIGRAGWAAGQLDEEVRDGHWRVIDATAESILTEAPDDLWVHLVPDAE